MALVSELILPHGMDFASYYRNTEAKVKVIPASSYRQDVVSDLQPEAESSQPRLPWHSAGRFYLRPGEVTLWPGINGSGKSYVTGMVMTSLIAQGQKVGIASFEMKPRKTLGRQLRQAFEGSNPTVDFAHRFIDWLAGKLWLYDHQGQVKLEALYGVVKYMAVDLGVTQVLIDSMMKCVKGEDDYNGQKDFIDNCCTLARDLGIHIHIVHHTRKGENDDRVPNKFDVKGSGSITDQVDNVLIVWRNRKKERDAETIGYDSSVPDALVIVDKQRNGDWEGKIALWLHKPSFQFCGESSATPINLMRFQ